MTMLLIAFAALSILATPAVGLGVPNDPELLAESQSDRMIDAWRYHQHYLFDEVVDTWMESTDYQEPSRGCRRSLQRVHKPDGSTTLRAVERCD